MSRGDTGEKTAGYIVKETKEPIRVRSRDTGEKTAGCTDVNTKAPIQRCKGDTGEKTAGCRVKRLPKGTEKTLERRLQDTQ